MVGFDTLQSSAADTHVSNRKSRDSTKLPDEDRFWPKQRVRRHLATKVAAARALGMADDAALSQAELKRRLPGPPGGLRAAPLHPEQQGLTLTLRPKDRHYEASLLISRQG